MEIEDYLKKYTWLIILAAIAISFLLPSIGSIFKPYLGYLLMILMFLSYLNINVKEVLGCLKNFRDELFSLATIHLASPLLVLLIKPLLPAEIFLGLIIATTMSSGMSVVFLSHLYGGKASQSLVITFLSNTLSPLIVPLLVFIFARTTIQISVVTLGLTLLKLVIIPFAIAILIRKFKFHQHLQKHADYISIIVLFALILGIVSPLRETILSNLELSLWLSGLIVILVLINFFLGFLIGRNKKERIAYAISVSYKNFTLATVIALSLFSPIVALPSILYSVINNLLLIPLQLVFRK
jgi:bile acid:Na+ symporter, BASS family